MPTIVSRNDRRRLDGHGAGLMAAWPRASVAEVPTDDRLAPH